MGRTLIRELRGASAQATGRAPGENMGVLINWGTVTPRGNIVSPYPKSTLVCWKPPLNQGV